MSDAYCHAADCIRDFLTAAAHHKYIIPVLVPDDGTYVQISGIEVSSGWTGAADTDWWQHCRRVSPCLNPDTGKTFSWAALAQFEPVDLRAAASAMGTEGMEVVRRIYSRLHRGDYVQYEASVRYEHWERRALLCSFENDVASAEGRKEAQQLFAQIDTDKDGKISEDELTRAFPQLGDAVARHMIHEADEDGDGLIDFQEFWDLIQAIGTEDRTIRSRPRRRASAWGAGKTFPISVCLQQLLEEKPQLGDHDSPPPPLSCGIPACVPASMAYNQSWAVEGVRALG